MIFDLCFGRIISNRWTGNILLCAKLITLLLIIFQCVILSNVFKIGSNIHKDEYCRVNFDAYTITFKVFMIINIIFTGIILIILLTDYPSNYIYIQDYNYINENRDVINVYRETLLVRYLFGLLSIITFVLLIEYTIDYNNNSSCNSEDKNIYVYSLCAMYLPYLYNSVFYSVVYLIKYIIIPAFILVMYIICIILNYVTCGTYIEKLGLFVDKLMSIRFSSLYNNYYRVRNNETNQNNNRNNIVINELIINHSREVPQLNEVVIHLIEELQVPQNVYMEHKECCVCYVDNFELTSCGHPICNNCDNNMVKITEKEIINNCSYIKTYKLCPICRNKYSRLIKFNNFMDPINNNDDKNEIVKEIINDIIMTI